MIYYLISKGLWHSTRILPIMQALVSNWIATSICGHMCRDPMIMDNKCLKALSILPNFEAEQLQENW